MAWEENTGIDAIDEELRKRGIPPEVLAKLSFTGRAQPAAGASGSGLVKNYQPGTPEYEAAVGATSPPKLSFMGAKPAPADVTPPEVGRPAAVNAQLNPTPALSFANPQPAAPTPNAPAAIGGAPPISLAQGYKDAEAQRAKLPAEPTREQFPAEKMPLWKKLLGAAASTAAGIRDPNVAGATARKFFGRPEGKAEEKFERADKTWKGQQGAIDKTEAGIAKEAGIANIESEITERENKPEPRVPEAEQAISDHLAATGRKDTPENRDAARGELQEQAKSAGPGNAKDKEMTDYLEARRLPDTAGNRDKARVAISERTKANQNVFSSNDAKDIAQSIMRGEQPPTVTGLYRNAGAVRAELARNGYDLARAELDWHATNKHLATLNGQQQERLRQAVTFTSDSLGIIEDLYGQWQKVGKTSGWQAFNKTSLGAAKQLPGEAGNIANRLDAQINDLTAELGTVYKGGNSSTDESLKLAAQNLKSEWNEQTFKAAIGQVRKNLEIRMNSIKHSQAAGVSANSPYTPEGEKDAAGAAATSKSWNAQTGKYE